MKTPATPKPCNVSEAEWEVMSVIWAESPLPASEVVERVTQHKSWTSRTIRTLLGRLTKKGALRVEEQGKRYLYCPKVSMEDCIKQESASFIRRIFGGEPASMLLHMVKETPLTPEQIKDLKKLLSQKEK